MTILTKSSRNGRAIPAMSSWIKDMFLEDFPITSFSHPKMNVIDGDREMIVQITATGIKKEDLDVSIDGGKINIKASASSESNTFLRREFSYSGFERAISIPDGIISEEITAELKDGILNIILPKDSKSSGGVKRIDIK